MNKNDYSKKVGARSKSLFGALIKMAVPVVASAAVEYGYEAAYKKIDAQLNEMFRQISVNSLVVLAINIIGVMVAVTKFLGSLPSKIFAGFIFLMAFVYNALNWYFSWKKNKDYYKMTWDCSKKVWQKKSLSNGIKAYVYEKNTWVQMFFERGIPFVDRYIPGMAEVIPGIDKIVRRLRADFWKKLTLFAGIFAAYFVLIYIILKPLILLKWG